MNTTPFPRKESIFACLDALAEPQGTSEIPTSEIAGPAKVVAAVATGSLPVLSAEAFYRELLEKITDWPRNDRGRRMAQSGLIFWDQMQKEKNRRQMEAPIQRQPEENTVHEPHRGSPSPTE